MKIFWSALKCVSLALLAGSCGDSPQPEAINHRSPAVEGAKPSEGGFVNLFTWDGYVDPALLEAFTAETGIEVRTEAFADTDEVDGAVRAAPDRYDVIIVDGDNVEKFAKLQLIHPMEKRLLPNLKHIQPQYLNLEIDPENRFSVPYLWGTTLIAYRKDLIPDPEKSWWILWDSAYKGHIGMLDERLESIGISLIKNGFSLNDRSETALQIAGDDLVRQVTELGVRYLEGVPSSIERELGSGTVWVMAAYSGDAAMVAGSNDAIDFFIPREGCSLWLDNFVIPRDSPRIREAHAFVNYLLSPHAAAQNANYLCYATPNAAAMKLINPELLQNEAIFPPESMVEQCEFLGKLNPKRERPANLVWARVMNVYHRQGGGDAKQTPIDTEASEEVLERIRDNPWGS